MVQTRTLAQFSAAAVPIANGMFSSDGWRAEVIFSLALSTFGLIVAVGMLVKCFTLNRRDWGRLYDDRDSVHLAVVVLFLASASEFVKAVSPKNLEQPHVEQVKSPPLRTKLPYLQ